MFRVRFLIAAALLAATFATTAGAGHAGGCTSGYAYVGAESPTEGYGVSATLETLARAVVASGHIAAWLGVGGPGLGPGGTDSWLQAGIAQDAGGAAVVYYEFKRPGDTAATYVPLEHAGQGEKHTLVVYERAGQRD